MAEKGDDNKSAAELRLEQLQKWREARGRQHRPGREPLTDGIVKHNTGTTTKANLPPSRETSTKKSSTVKRKQKENAAHDDSYLERFEQWRSEKKKQKERESASKRPPWRPCSASKTNLLSHPLTRCCNHDHGTGPRSRKRLAMGAGAAAGDVVQNDAELQDDQELHAENNGDVRPNLNNVDDIQDNQEVQPHNDVDNTEELQLHVNNMENNQDNLEQLANLEDNQEVQPHNDMDNTEGLQPHVNNMENNQDNLEQLANLEDNQEVQPHNDMDNTEGLQPHVNNMHMENNQDNHEQLSNLEDNQDDPEAIPDQLGNLENTQEVLQPAGDNQSNPEPLPDTGDMDPEDNPEPLLHIEDILNNPEVDPIVEDGQASVEDIPVEEVEQEDGAQPHHMETEENGSQDIQHVTFEELFTELSSPGAEEDLTDDATSLPRYLLAMDVPETEEPAKTAVTPLINVSDGETDLNMVRRDSLEDDDDSDIIAGAAAVVPKKMSMRQKLEQWLKEKGKTPSRFNSILTFRTPAPGSARRKLRKRRSAAPFWPGLGDAGKEEEDAGKDAVTLGLEAIFRECMSAIDEGYPADNISGILDTVFSSIPQCVQHSQYWLCRARLAEVQGDDHRVVSVFEMAVAAHAEPYEDIKDALTAFVLRKEAELSPQAPEDAGIDHVQPTVLFKTPRRRSAFPRLDQGVAFDSSMKMYSVTPLFRRAHGVLRKAAPVPVATVAPIVVTPVRRSARIHRASALHPPALREHDPCVPSLADVSEEEFVLRANRALVRDSAVVNSDDSVLRGP